MAAGCKARGCWVAGLGQRAALPPPAILHPPLFFPSPFSLTSLFLSQCPFSHSLSTHPSLPFLFCLFILHPFRCLFSRVSFPLAFSSPFLTLLFTLSRFRSPPSSTFRFPSMGMEGEHEDGERRRDWEEREGEREIEEENEGSHPHPPLRNLSSSIAHTPSPLTLLKAARAAHTHAVHSSCMPSPASFAYFCLSNPPRSTWGFPQER